METLPSCILDSKHILQLLESLKSLSENAILTTADVTSLYTNIMHDDNIESVLHYTNLHADTLLPGSLSPHKVGILFETILKNNNDSCIGIFSNWLSQPWEPKQLHHMPTFSWTATKKSSRRTLSGQSSFWKRFIDNTFLIFLSTITINPYRTP